MEKHIDDTRPHHPVASHLYNEPAGALSSAGERCLHTAEVTGSIPVAPTVQRWWRGDWLLLAVLSLIALAAGWVLVAGGGDDGEVTPPGSGTPPPPRILASDLMSRLAVVEEYRSGYRRSLFPHWVVSEPGGCDTRTVVLLRDSRLGRDSGKGGTCRVTSGLWHSPYDGRWVSGTAHGVEVDHLVPLQEAWDSGAYGWDAPRREGFANDLLNLIAVTPEVNQAKGAHDPATWLPPVKSFRCHYITLWIVVKARWGLAVDSREAAMLHTLLAGDCRGWMVSWRKPP